ncbi:MAG: pantetheine-phosphate adenylyltransferase [Bdellovibrionales bacterium]
MSEIAIYPGSFDPITKGHIDILERFSRVFTKIYIGVGFSPKKSYLFNLEERQTMVREAVTHLQNIEVVAFEGLTVEFAKGVNANFILRGVRSAGDFEYEQNMANMNYRLNKEIETLLLYSKPELNLVSSSLIKEVFALGGDVSQFVTENVIRELVKKIKV